MAYTTVEEVKAYLGIANSNDDALLATLVAAAQSDIDEFTGKSFEAKTGTYKYDAIQDVLGRRLQTRRPLLSVTTLTNGDGVVIPSTEYVLWPSGDGPYYEIVLKRNSGYCWVYDDSPEEAISVAGSWGYSATANASITSAAIRWTAYKYRQKDTGVYDVTAMPDTGVIMIPQGMPKDVYQLLRKYGVDV